jgi:hypothetical protein
MLQSKSFFMQKDKETTITGVTFEKVRTVAHGKARWMMGLDGSWVQVVRKIK